MNDLENVYNSLREDVRLFFDEMALEPHTDQHHIRDDEFYSRCKNHLSEICGWDAPIVKRDQSEFDKSLDYLIEKIRM